MSHSRPALEPPSLPTARSFVEAPLGGGVHYSAVVGYAGEGLRLFQDQVQLEDRNLEMTG
jgi:hypothetical protein